jgi:hypothetical protein
MRYLSIKNFAKHQHYKDRRPPWIKLHVEVLDDYAFACLQDASKAHLMLLWVLASKMDNRIPYDLAFLSRKLGATSPVDLEELVLQGFIEVSQDDGKVLAPRKQSAMPETETETEAETETDISSPRATEKVRPSSEYPADFSALWAMYPKRHGGNPKREAYLAWRARLRAGVPAEVLHAGVMRYKAFCEATEKVGGPFVMQGATFLGPGERYLEPWEVESAAVVVEAPRVLRATEMLL